MRIVTCALAASLAVTGCVTGDPGAVKDEFADEVGPFQDEFGNGKADLFGLDIDPCKLLGPLAELGDDGIRSGLVIGVEGEGVLGTAVGFGGFDLVWDLYHQQLSVSRYAGAGFGLPGAGASVQGYVGAGFGFEEGVSDWDGYIVGASADISLPLLRDFVSLEPAVFVSGEDRNGDHVISPSEVLAPPNGVYGFTMGVSLGFDLLPDPSPVGGSIVEGYWQQYKTAVRAVYERLRGVKMFYVKDLQVRLVDAENGEACPESWPDQDGGRECVIEFGDPADSYLSRSVHTAYSMCYLTGRCAVPLTWPMSASALAVGALRSSGLSFSQFCK